MSTNAIKGERLRTSHLALERDGELVRVIEVPDARQAMIDACRRIDDGFTLHPISVATARAMSKRRVL